MTVFYNVENDLPPRQFIDVLLRSGLAPRRPVDQPERIATMVENANLVVTASAILVRPLACQTTEML